MLKPIIFLFLLLGSFGSGYYLGSAGTQEIKKKYLTLQNEMRVKSREVNAEITSIRLRLNMIETRRLLGSARSNVQDKNFGAAEVEIEKAKGSIDKAIAVSAEPQKNRLTLIQSELESIRADIRQFDTKSAPKIEAIEKTIAKMAD